MFKNYFPHKNENYFLPIFILAFASQILTLKEKKMEFINK